MASDQLSLRSLPGTGRAKKNETSLHLVVRDKNCHSRDRDDRDAKIKPEEGTIARCFATCVRRSVRPSPDSPLAQESIVMPLDKMRLHLPHRVEDNADDNEQTGAAKKLSGNRGNMQALTQ